MGYKRAIVPGLLFKAAIAACDAALAAPALTHPRPDGATDMPMRQAFNREGGGPPSA